MKLSKIFYAGVAALALFSCSQWTEPEREILPNQEGLIRRVPFLDAKSEADLPPSLRKHYEAIREYRKTDHVLGFGWFGNWTAKGADPNAYLKGLPDSVDFVSLWGTRGSLTQEQKEDLEYFQKIKGGKALLCWIVQDVGDQLTPPGKSQSDYWLKEKGGGDPIKACEAYADAIADTIQKYNLDGFDIDFEPGYGHSSRNDLMPISQSVKIADTPPEGSTSANKYMNVFIKKLRSRLDAMGKGKLLVMDGEPEHLSSETSKMIDYYIYQAYWESSSSQVRSKVNHKHLDNYIRKTIITVEFEQKWRTGGITNYESDAYPELNDKNGVQIYDYATLDIDGIRIAGIGTYHMEYDKQDMPYKWLRSALDRANKEVPGKFKK